MPSSMVSQFKHKRSHELLSYTSSSIAPDVNDASFCTDESPTVKFDGAKLPAILNSLETENNGQKLVLEVSVRHTKLINQLSAYAWHGLLTYLSNIWVRTSSDALPWTVCRRPI